MSDWADLTDVARHAHVTPQRLRFIATHPRTSVSAKWHGVIVRHVPGPQGGGKAGIHLQFYIPSLPTDVYASLKTSQQALRPLSKLRDDTAAERDWWSLILSPAAMHPKKSRERSAAIKDILTRPLTDWNGRQITLTERTLQRKLNLYEQGGVGALAGRVRRDKGERRVEISERWDRAVPFNRDRRRAIASELRTHVRGLFKQTEQATKLLHMLAGDKLRELTAEHCDYASAMPARTFEVPRAFIEAERKYGEVAKFKKDRKAYEDTKPRIHRTREGLVPMEIVVGDVHHLDIVIRRPDGTEAWPKAIAWLDLATNRIWLDVVLLGKGEGVRNADVIASFVRMVTAWGMPSTLYLDNGPEYHWADFVDDALKLVSGIYFIEYDRKSRVVRAKPYNAPAKAIEGIFRVLEYIYFRIIQGWTGGDRTNKKTANVGRSPEPFAEAVDKLRVLIGHCLALYEVSRQRGSLNNRSPREVYEAAIVAGWQKVAIDPRELRTVFATSKECIVRQGAIKYGGQSWTCDKICKEPIDRVFARIPKFEQPAMLPLLDEAGKVLGFAVPVTQYPILDPAGAREAARISGLRRQGIKELDASAPDIDVPAEIARMAAALPAPLDATVCGTVSISDQAREMAAGLAETPESRDDRRRARLEDEQRKLVESTLSFTDQLLHRKRTVP